MPNYCYYTMKVKAKNNDNLMEFVKIMQGDYDYTNLKFTTARHMWRIFEATFDEDAIEEDEDDNSIAIYIYGNCAWSVHSCMLEGKLTYHNDHLNDPRNSSLLRESKLLDLEIEVYGEETGEGFQEHYLIKNGELFIDECRDIREYCCYDYDDCEDDEKIETLNEINNKLQTNYESLEEFFNGNEYVTIGGFDDFGEFSF